ncbi:hypothetical protein TOPH_04933 [Tolypocladium ophioglossoides CBS 100239]|uniref:Uncharacterized protein n=1 Tax=Tolypocladium ophioglossoides (strain CBS 100239) TaxID=1163406 RepID=A0A0L0N8J6_TOLOC|nr:hypothetical protein TOPH_04933 [Tolypocladium ophioglossoides CBS 100239]
MTRRQGGPRPPAGQGDHPRRSSQQQSSDRGSKAFAKIGAMETAKSQMHAMRQASTAAAEEGHLRAPPPDPSLIQASLVIPGQHMLPRGLDNPAALDDIRKKHKVWITRVQPNVLELRGESIRRLQEAMSEINWALHDMRLSGGNPTTRFLAQKPVNVPDSAVVRVDVNTRPHVATMKRIPGDTLPAALDIFHQLHPGLVPSMDVLRGLGTELKMRVNFGRLQVRMRKKGLGNEMTYTNFAKMMPGYSVRGGAGLDTRLSDAHVADKVAQLLMDPAAGILDDENLVVQRRCAILLQIGDQELVAEVETPSTERVQVSASRMTRTDKWTRLNWTVAAPDMSVEPQTLSNRNQLTRSRELDWNLQVVPCETMTSMPTELRKLAGGIVLIPDGAGGDQTAALKPPRVLMTTRAGGDKVDETLLKTSILVPFKDTPFLVEISVTQAWSGLKTNTTPETWWGVEFYGQHWDEAINHVSPGERRKDWGPGLRDIWLGRSPSLEERFMEFLEHVLKIQSALGEADFSAAKEDEKPEEELVPLSR